LSRFVPSGEVKGLCQNLHERATGMTTAEHTKLLNAAKNAAKKAK
jgi:hypothetical protein